MTDLTNRSVEEVNILIQKYAPVLETVKFRTVPEYQILAIAIDVAINHIQTKYDTLSTDWKAWSVVALKQNFKKVKTEEDVKKIIDDFVEYYKTEFENYRVVMCEYPLIDLECDFVHRFSMKKNR